MPSGAAAEDRAAEYLQRQGLKLVARNYRCRQGEIDLILREGTTLVFVEVRSRASSAFGGAAASITQAKQAKLIRAAQHYLSLQSSLPACRFDAVLIDGNDLQWLKHAFEVVS
ncbi:MAG: YraN family protein [Hydrogenophilaceae bacterium]|nr:YraN family protein [Hydrogenophilaceae bacterium]